MGCLLRTGLWHFGWLCTVGGVSAQGIPTPTPTPVLEASSVENDLPEEQPERGYPYLTTRGQLQLQFDQGNRGAVRGDDPVFNGLAPFRGSDQLDIRRARVVTSLHLSPEIQILNESNYDTRTNQISVLDLYLRAQLSRELDLRAGMFKIPFGWEGLRSSRGTNTIEMSDVTRGISSFRDSGLSLGYVDGPLEGTLAVVQGQSGVWTDRNAAKDVVGRLVYGVAPELKLGISGHVGSFRPEFRDQDLPVRRLGLEMQYHEDDWKVEAEFLWSWGFNYVSRRDSRAYGYYLTLVRQLNQANDLVLHFDSFEPDADRVVGLTALNEGNRRNRLVVGWNHYFRRNPEHRIMFNYEFVNEEEGPRLNNNGLRVRYQWSW